MVNVLSRAHLLGKVRKEEKIVNCTYQRMTFMSYPTDPRAFCKSVAQPVKICHKGEMYAPNWKEHSNELRSTDTG